MSARETHVTEWGLYLLARPPSDPLEGLSGLLIDEMERAGFRAGFSRCGADGAGVNIGYHHIRTTVPTCPRCAVLRDEALEGRLPKREAKT